MSIVQDAPKINETQVVQQPSEKRTARIHNFEDLIVILRTHPAWLEEIRRLVLSEELMQLPKKFDDFVKNEFHPLKQQVDHIEQRVGTIEQRVGTIEQRVGHIEQRVEHIELRVGRIEQDVEVLKRDVESLKTDVAELKGDNFERKVREKAPSYFGKLIKRCRVLSSERLADVLDDAVDKGVITELEREDALRTDVAVTGILRSDNREIVVVSEVSVKVDRVDVERACRRGQILARAFELPYIAVTIGRESTEGAVAVANELDVILI